MKRVVFGLSLALAAFGFFSSPALAGPQQQGGQALSSADGVFLASLATEAPSVTEGKQPIGGGEKALCGANAACGGGVTVSCTSNSSVTSCSAADRNCAAGEQGHVTCNGVTTWCSPSCHLCTTTASCGDGTSLSCYSDLSPSNCGAADRNCPAGERGHVTCDGSTISCSKPCPLCSTSALCGDGSFVSCESSQSPNNCSAADKSCPYEQGHVTCDGNTSWCSNSCCSIDCSADEWSCAMSCGSCPYRFTCNELNCSESCSCSGFGGRFCELQEQ
jgi:hypothetical protein